MDFDIVNKTVCLVGKRASGKSRLLRYIVLMNKNRFDKIFIICPTEPLNSFYKGIVPDENIFDNYSDKWMENLFKRATEENSNKEDKDKKKILLILDDICSDVSMHTCKPIKKYLPEVDTYKLVLLLRLNTCIISLLYKETTVIFY